MRRQILLSLTLWAASAAPLLAADAWSAYRASFENPLTAPAPQQQFDAFQAPPPVAGELLASSNGCCLPCWYFQADALYWQRVGAGCDQVLVIDTGAAPGTGNLLSTSDLDFDGSPGMRFLLGWQPHRACAKCCLWELSYFGIYDWEANETVTGAGNLGIPGDLGLASNNFFFADQIDVRYQSELNNVELNCIHACCQCATQIDFLCGLRYISLDENLSIVGNDAQEGVSSYDVETDNDLFGAQLGGRLRRRWNCWSMELIGKAGVFYNEAQQRQQVTDFPGIFLRAPVGADEEGVAMLGEIGITAIRQLSDTWGLRFGYTALGLGGVALAPDQLDFSDTPFSGSDVSTTGWFFAHGVNIGLEARW